MGLCEVFAANASQISLGSSIDLDAPLTIAIFDLAIQLWSLALTFRANMNNSNEAHQSLRAAHPPRQAFS